jgi:hypothetical protein
VDYASNFTVALTPVVNLLCVFSAPQPHPTLDALGLPRKFESNMFRRLTGAQKKLDSLTQQDVKRVCSRGVTALRCLTTGSMYS